MAEYAITVEKFRKQLASESIVLRRSDIEYIVAKLEEKNPKQSEIVRWQRAHEFATQLYGMVQEYKHDLKSEAWDGKTERRKRNVLEELAF